MMSRLAAFIAAEGISIDQISSRVTAYNMIDAVYISALPAMLLRLSTISLYELGPAAEEFTERVTLVSPQGEMIGQSETRLALPARTQDGLPNGHRSVHTLWKSKLPVSGDYLLRATRHDDSGNQQLLAQLLLTVVVQRHPILNAQAPQLSIPSVPEGS